MANYVLENRCKPEEIRAKRKELKMTQKEFAEFTGVSKPTVERWENSKTDVVGPIALLIKMLTPEYLEDISIPERTAPLRMWYMYKDIRCTLIDVNEAKQSVSIKNYTDRVQFRAFGIIEKPSFKDFEDFLEERCFSKNRDKLKLVLDDLDLPFYDPYLIIEKTEGRMAEDDFWILVEK